MRAVSSQKRVVAVIARAYDAYQRGIIAVVRQRLAEAGYGTVCLMEGELGLDDLDSEKHLRRIDGGLDVQGLIVLSGILGNSLPVDALARYVNRFVKQGLPLVSLGVTVPGVASVALDSTNSLCALMAHMTLDPTRRCFAFIQGHASGPDSIERERVFRRELARKGIPVDERLVFEGRFIGADAYAGLDSRLRQGLRIDAVVAANDLMAGAAVMALEKHGLSVPHDVIVSGFDDAPRTMDSQPALTTIPQYIDRQALCAVELLLDGLADQQSMTAEKSILIETELVIRRSSNPESASGNLSAELARATALSSGLEHESLHDWLLRRLNSVLPPEHVDVHVLADAVFSALEGDDKAWIFALREALANTTLFAQYGRWGQHLLAQLQALYERIELPQRPLLRQACSRLESSLEVARESDQFERGAQRLRHERLLLQLAACPNESAIWSLLRSAFVSLGIRRAWVMLNDDDPRSDSGRRLVFSADESQSDCDEVEFIPRSDILPARLAAELEKGLLVLFPLKVGDGRYMGQLLVDPENSTTLELGSIAANLAQALARASDAASLHESNQSLMRVAHYDSLTGLPNRACFKKTLETTLASADEHCTEASLLFLDLDGFKLINDTLGHSAGDQLLCIIGARIKRVLRSEDTLARLGGDEFTILLTQNADLECIRRVAEEVINAVARPCKLDKRLVDTSVSIGVARYPRDGADAETLLQNADTAMYHAKASGKNRHSFYEQAFNREAISRLELLEDLRRGINSAEFRMHYQPRIDLESSALVGFEALMRWRRGSDGAEIGPDRFIPIAEDSGLVNVLDKFALDAVCKQGALWSERGTPVQVSVNLSMRCLQEPDIVERVSDTLHRHNLDPGLLELEITESAAMQDVQKSIETVSALRALGVQIAIDDFGSGYSSLSYLQKLPVTSLKIDRSFFGSISEQGDTDPADIAIVSAVVALGTALGFRIVAEGIENDAQHALARELRCDEGQGWLFGRALSVENATRYLDDNMSMPLSESAAG